MDNTPFLQEFRALVERSLRMQKVIFYSLGTLAWLLGLGMAIAYIVELESTPIAVFIVGLCLCAAGIWMVAYYYAQNQNTLWLLFDRTHDIQDIKVVMINRGTMGTIYALHFVDKNQAKRGVMVPSEAYAEAVKKMYLG